MFTKLVNIILTKIEQVVYISNDASRRKNTLTPFSSQILLFPLDYLSPILCHARVSWAYWMSSAGHVAVSEPSPGSDGRDGNLGRHLTGGPHTCGMTPVEAPPKVRPGHPGYVHFGLLKPISIIPRFRSGPIGPKGPYLNQTIKNNFTYLCRYT